MASTNRSAQFNHLHKVLKKLYKPILPDSERPVLEHLLFAACLENAHYAAADEAFATLVHNFFDWNEIRVSTVRELAEVMSGLPDPPAAAARVKGILQSVFEATYSFDVESLRKLNLGPAEEKLKESDGATPFVVAYVVQSALGGHAIPVDSGTMAVLHILDLATEKNVEEGVVTGMERAVAKTKGIDFGSLLHQLGADFTANPYAPTLRETFTEINPEAKNRWPKRRSKKQLAAEAEKEAASKKAKKKAAEKAELKKKKVTDKKAPAVKKKASGDSPKAPKKATAKKKPAAAKKKPAAKKKAATAAKISKRKPR